MKIKSIILTLLLGFFSINATAVPNNNMGKQIAAFSIIAIMKSSTVIAKAVGDINNHVDNNNTEILERLLQHDHNIENQLTKLTAIGISALSLTIFSIFLICYANFSCKLPEYY
jgi:hypothetical protein